jgi:hypothetical protein
MYIWLHVMPRHTEMVARGRSLRHESDFGQHRLTHPPDSEKSDGVRHRRPMAAPPRGNRHENQGVRAGGQGQNRTADTRIFSTGEGRRGRREAEDREGVFDGPTEPPSPTEPIPSRSDRTSHRPGAGGHAGQGVAVGRTEPGPNLPRGQARTTRHFHATQVGRPLRQRAKGPF